MSLLPLAFGLLRDAVFAVVLLVAGSLLMREGFAGLGRKTVTFLRCLHGVDTVISWFLRREVRGFLRQLDPKAFSGQGREKIAIPEKGRYVEVCGGLRSKGAKRSGFTSIS